MSHTVTALYDSREEAAQALAALRAEVPLHFADIYNPTAASVLALQRLDLTAEERTACEDKLLTGDFLLLAQPPSGEGPEEIIAALERAAEQPVDEPHFRTPPEGSGAIVSNSPAAPDERRLPREDGLHVGVRTVVRGGARVHTRLEDVPCVQEIDLVSECVRLASRPVSRSVSEQELERSGLLRDRVFEIAQVREEAVVGKEAVIREEVIVSKTTEHRLERIYDTVPPTVLETEGLATDQPGRRGQR